MRLDLVFDSFYALGAVWGALTGSQVCPANAFHPPSLARDAARTLRPTTRAGVTAFIDVAVIPMDRERVLRGQTVLVEGGRITALGPSRQIAVPAGAVRIDGRGKYLIPGLGDMHVHDLEHGDIRGDTPVDVTHLSFSFLADGVTTVRQLEHDRISQAQWQMIRTGEVPSPRVYASGIQVGTPGSVGVPHRNQPSDGKVLVPGGQRLERPDSAAAIVAVVKAAGYTILNVATTDVYARKEYPVVDSVLAAARRAGLKIAAHDHDRSFGKVMTLGTVDGAVEHLEWLRDTLGLPVENYSDPLGKAQVDAIVAKLPALAATAARANLWVTPTLNCLEMRYVMSADQRQLTRTMVKALQDANVGLLLSGDDGKNVHSELVALVRAGLTPYQALLTGTRNIAEYFNLSDSSGTVAVGKWADLVLLSGNPLSDIRHTREPAGVMIGGRWLDREALDRGLLASPRNSRAKSWIRRSVLFTGINPQPLWEARTRLEARVRNFEDLTDSLAEALARGREGEPTVRRMRGLMLDEFRAMRRLLKPDQYETFDLLVRMWQRAQKTLDVPS